MSDGEGTLIATGVCVVLAAFYSGAETALTAMGEARARQLVEEQGHASLKLWLAHPDRVLATLLFANTVVNTLAAALTTAFVADLGLPHAVVIATAAVTLLLLLFGEITPKTLARQYATKLAPAFMPLVTLTYYVCFPLVIGLSALPRWVDRLFNRNKPSATPRTSITSEEIEYMIDLGVRHGILDREKSALLTSVLEFTDTVTREIMVPRMNVVGLPITATREQVFRQVMESEHSRIPVYKGSIDEIVGVLYVRTLLADIGGKRLDGQGVDRFKNVPFDIQLYIRPPFFVPESMKISRLLREFQRRKVHLAIVVDEFGGTAGVVALEDVVEEIVGEIQDELDVEEGRIRHLANGTVVADAAVAMRDLEETLGVDFPEAVDYGSLGGFVTAQAGKVPPVGAVVLWRGLRFTVRAGDERRVKRVEITRVKEPTPSSPGEPRPKQPEPPAES